MLVYLSLKANSSWNNSYNMNNQENLSEIIEREKKILKDLEKGNIDTAKVDPTDEKIAEALSGDFLFDIHNTESEWMKQRRHNEQLQKALRGTYRPNRRKRAR